MIVTLHVACDDPAQLQLQLSFLQWMCGNIARELRCNGDPDAALRRAREDLASINDVFECGLRLTPTLFTPAFLSPELR